MIYLHVSPISHQLVPSYKRKMRQPNVKLPFEIGCADWLSPTPHQQVTVPPMVHKNNNGTVHIRNQ
jgi:hypothetical protein